MNTKRYLYKNQSIPFVAGASLSRSQRSYLNLAAKAAEASECVHRHGAVVVKGGSVQSIGVNKWRNVGPMPTSHMDEYFQHISIHAEVDALSRLSNAQGATIYIARVSKAGEHRMSKPCPDCTEAILKAGVSKVVYTTSA